ncbi:DMT family transporter [Cellulosilyticum sp. I15G10I2]|uniref:DMT family transporter n=1 Tax=Cellulosilyticum sp. I15G10I2 TaxID=1892843 RepID=UPI00085C63C5|nr:DMT family transporter [Cellulosilyticum sp. I15G10I2]
MFVIILSFLAGVSIVAARIINANLAKRIGVFEGTFFNYVVGLLFSFTILIFSQETLYPLRANLHNIPWWAYLGGLIGVLIVILSTYMTSKISSFYLTLLVFIGQFFVGIIIDYMRFDLLSAGKILGGFFVLAGLTYNLIIDKKTLPNS